jgi:hypothetical protein
VRKLQHFGLAYGLEYGTYFPAYAAKVRASNAFLSLWCPVLVIQHSSFDLPLKSNISFVQTISAYYPTKQLGKLVASFRGPFAREFSTLVANQSP